MRRLWLLLMIGLSWWLWPVQRPQAISTYDPVQGGIFWEPPAEVWLPKNSNMLIPFAYLPGGVFQVNKNTKIEAQAHKLQNGKPSAASSGIINVNADKMGVSAGFESTGDYQINVTLTVPQTPQVPREPEVYQRTVIAHVTDPPIIRTMLPLPTQRLLTPIPLLIETADPNGAGFLDVKLAENPSKFLQANISTPYVVPVPGTMQGTVVQIIDATLSLNSATTTYGQVSFGLAPIIAKGSQPIRLAAAYLAPRPGTVLTFEWVYQDVEDKMSDSRLTSDPWLEVPETWYAPGKLQVRLHYDYEGKRVSVYSNEVDYHYQPAPATQTVMTANVADLLAHDVMLESGWSDWQIDQPGTWQLEVAVASLRSPEGAELAANLILPDGTAVAAGQARRLVYNGAYNLALTQAKWLLQQQPDVLKGQYQTQVRFTVISGPE